MMGKPFEQGIAPHFVHKNFELIVLFARQKAIRFCEKIQRPRHIECLYTGENKYCDCGHDCCLTFITRYAQDTNVVSMYDAEKHLAYFSPSLSACRAMPRYGLLCLSTILYPNE